MATFEPLMLSGSSNGLPIPVAATATPGTLVHTAIAGTTSRDEIYLWVSNVTGSTATLTLEWGGTTAPTNHLVTAMSVPPNSPPIPIAPGVALRNSLNVRAFSGTASALNLTGYCLRFTP
jgi:hypothetical protein